MNPIEKDYYQPGKIFRFQNIISAFKTNKEDEIKSKNTYDDDVNVNVWFHIFSTEGRDVTEFISGEELFKN